MPTVAMQASTSDEGSGTAFVKSPSTSVLPDRTLLKVSALLRPTMLPVAVVVAVAALDR